jgi:hypothetical protein
VISIQAVKRAKLTHHRRSIFQARLRSRKGGRSWPPNQSAPCEQRRVRDPQFRAKVVDSLSTSSLDWRQQVLVQTSIVGMGAIRHRLFAFTRASCSPVRSSDHILIRRYPADERIRWHAPATVSTELGRSLRIDDRKDCRGSEQILQSPSAARAHTQLLWRAVIRMAADCLARRRRLKPCRRS